MSKKLITLVFEKSETDIGSKVKNRMAQHLSEVLSDEYNYPFSTKSFTNLYNKFIEADTPANEDLKPELTKCLCKYLGYKNYAEFVTAHPSELEEPKIIVEPIITKDSEPEIQEPVKSTSFGFFNQGRNKIVSLISVVVISTLTYFGFVREKQNCMVWQEDHYVQSACAGAKYEEPYQELLVLNFRKINDLEEVRARYEQHQELWYLKTGGEVEFFTYYNVHPVYHKGLHKVTDYMYKTHVLDKVEQQE
ncbi:hypothetical protein I2486_04170 [Cellulophaga sp. E16_2]|uniref:hypothetical protein n=1 Tax=Cellulophaga sp. E16_2 TaxID=2789297 RepID=UPI001A91843C|nr:hypothetical protein [Cellulophaga sp. E16_2]MBO0590594.1 hypothetical protein [Cellulophaga sp. E16_2]